VSNRFRVSRSGRTLHFVRALRFPLGAAVCSICLKVNPVAAQAIQPAQAPPQPGQTIISGGGVVTQTPSEIRVHYPMSPGKPDWVITKMSIVFPTPPGQAASGLHLAGCNANGWNLGGGGPSPCTGTGQKLIPKNAGTYEKFFVCHQSGTPNYFIGGKCDVEIDRNRKGVSARCTSTNDGNPGGQGGHADYYMSSVELVSQVTDTPPDLTMCDPAPGLPEHPQSGGIIAPVRCDNGTAMCGTYRNGYWIGDNQPCPPGVACPTGQESKANLKTMRNKH